MLAVVKTPHIKLRVEGRIQPKLLKVLQSHFGDCARRLPSILPPLSLEEAIETTKIYSVAGRLGHNHHQHTRGLNSLMNQRPFCTPHHTASEIGLIGGGSHPRPGEISLAHNGILFLDELPEFQRRTLEAMRETDLPAPPLNPAAAFSRGGH